MPSAARFIAVELRPVRQRIVVEHDDVGVATGLKRPLRRICGVLASRISAGISVHLRSPSISGRARRSRTQWRKNRVNVPEERGCDTAPSGNGQSSPL